MIPPKPVARPRQVSLWRYWRMFRRDILSAQPEHLYRAKMAEFRTPFFRSYLVNELSLVRHVLIERAAAFPKSNRVTRGLRPLLGRSVFVTNGAEWAHQRRIIDPAFEGGRLKESFPAMLAAADAAVARLEPGAFDVEAMASHATADVIFRTLFSLPIEDAIARQTYDAFRAFQRTQPVAMVSALLPWVPCRPRRAAREAAAELRGLIGMLVKARHAEIAAGTAPADLATKIMTTPDPKTGQTFSEAEMVDQVAIFFLAGHETSASLLGWALWCLAAAPEWAAQVSEESRAFWEAPAFSALSKMPVTRNVLRETLRLYPPVPMFVRETTEAEQFRNRGITKGAQIVISPWHLGRHEAFWQGPDSFDPARWEGDTPAREAWIPFSAGPRVCPGAGFAMTEATVLLAALMACFRFEVLDRPVPVAHLTVRSRDGIRLRAARLGPAN
ncbi:MAG: cytochrome P450 [Pseudomonadota bacterium]